METKDKIKVLFSIDADGYIIGYQQEFYDGTDWQTPFDATNAIDLSANDLDSIVFGATKVTDGKLVVDQSKIADMQAANDAAEKQAVQDQVTITSLKQKNDLLQSAVMELSNYVFSLPDGSTTGSAN